MRYVCGWEEGELLAAREDPNVYVPLVLRQIGCRNYEDAYTDPGSPMSRKTQWNTYVLAQLDNQQKLLLEGLP